LWSIVAHIIFVSFFFFIPLLSSLSLGNTRKHTHTHTHRERERERERERVTKAEHHHSLHHTIGCISGKNAHAEHPVYRRVCILNVCGVFWLLFLLEENSPWHCFFSYLQIHAVWAEETPHQAPSILCTAASLSAPCRRCHFGGDMIRQIRRTTSCSLHRPLLLLLLLLLLPLSVPFPSAWPGCLGC